MSSLLSTAGLWVLLLVGVGLSAARPLAPPGSPGRPGLLALALLAVALQAVHFAEELVAGFSVAFPAVFGLEALPTRLFVAFNLAWLAIWPAAILAVRRGWRWAEWPLWFLAVALVANGVAHPVLALREGGYFPGLVTALLAVPVGVLLLRRLVRLSSSADRDAGGRGP